MLNVSISFANLVMWILVGGLAGWLASLVVRGGGLGLVGDVLVGVIGAFLGGFLLSQVFPSLYAFTGGFTGFSVGSLIVAFVGAVVLLLITPCSCPGVHIRRRSGARNGQERPGMTAASSWLDPVQMTACAVSALPS
jgi:uncharacterized membrane protein YeaQ/YmgE (transglycosylase-associated protein family)